MKRKVKGKQANMFRKKKDPLQLINRRVPFMVGVFYAFGCVMEAAMLNVIAFYSNFFLLNVVGLQAINVGIMLLVTRTTDAFFGPIFGYASDNTVPLLLGKRKSWIMMALIPAGVLYVALWYVPSDTGVIASYQNGILAYYTIMYVLFEICMTIIKTNYDCFVSEMTYNPADSIQLVTRKNIVYVLTAMISSGLIANYFKRADSDENVSNTRNKYIVAAVVVYIVGVFCIVPMLCTAYERVHQATVIGSNSIWDARFKKAVNMKKKREKAQLSDSKAGAVAKKEPIDISFTRAVETLASISPGGQSLIPVVHERTLGVEVEDDTFPDMSNLGSGIGFGKDNAGSAVLPEKEKEMAPPENTSKEEDRKEAEGDSDEEKEEDEEEGEEPQSYNGTKTTFQSIKYFFICMCRDYKEIFRNKPFVMLCMTNLCTSTVVTVLQATILLYVKYVLREPESSFDDTLWRIYGGVLAGLIFTSIFPVLLNAWCHRSFNKKLTAQLVICCWIGMCISLYWTKKSAVVEVGFGVCTAITTIMLHSMVPETIDYGQETSFNNTRRDGSYYSFFAVFQKIGLGIALAMINIVLGLQGFVSDQKDNTSQLQPWQVVRTLHILFVFFPAILLCTSLIPLYFYDITVYVQLPAPRRTQYRAETNHGDDDDDDDDDGGEPDKAIDV
jgi:Na+/melibiose symporter-like transporter